MTRRGAFTLVEMMVALAITGVLTVMMLKMFSDSSTIWKTEDERLDTFREARAALQLMSRELATTLPLTNATVAGMTENYPALALRGLKTQAVTGLSSQYYTSAYLLSSVPNAGKGDLCAIGYYLQWEPSIVSTGSTASPRPSTPTPRSCYTLRRQSTQSDSTFARLRTTLSSTLPLFGKDAFELLYSTSAPPVGPGVTPLPAPVVETMATYIWDLQFAVPAGAAATPTPPPSGAVVPPLPGKNGFYGTTLAPWIEIRFKALGANAARKIGNNPLITEDLWQHPEEIAYKRFILPSEQQFVSRVKLTR